MSDIYRRLHSLETLGIKFGLENIRRLLDGLGNPDQSYPSILIAGTNGKGSVGAMLEAILIRNGYHTGYYLSPHLIDVRERIRVLSHKISDSDFEQTLEKVFAVADRLSITATYFEALTAGGLLHFKEAQVQAAVVEVGLGGRFDATNAILQALSIITSIGLDHEKFLGKSLENIAVEKAMISKREIPLLVGDVPVEALRAIHSVSRDVGCPIYTIPTTDIVDGHLEDGFPNFIYKPWGKHIRVNLRGAHQINNAAIALAASAILRNKGWNISEELTIQALDRVQWPGRLDIVPGDTPLLLDSAHNPMGVRALVQYLSDVEWKKNIFLFTAMKDKNIEEMMRSIAPACERIVLCRVEPFDRCATKQQLCEAADRAGMSWIFHEDAPDALVAAQRLSAKTRLPTVACGSIYFIGRLFALLDLAT